MTTSSHGQKDAEDLSPEEVLSITRKFFTREWSSLTPDQISVSRIKSGWVNRVYIAERTSIQDEGTPLVEPTKILIKKYGGNVTDMDAEEGVQLTREEELLVCQEWARIGLGPKLYGVFPEGRLEEYIESHIMTRDDCLKDPSIRRDMASCLARFHSLELPICKEPYDFVVILERMVCNFRQKVEPSFRTNKILLERGIDTSLIGDYDFESDLKWLKNAMQPEHHRTVFIHWDTHMENVLVRNHAKEGESRVVVIDLQQACYNFRGKDLGLHLTSMMVDFTKPSERVLDFPPKDYYWPLFQEYLDEVENLGFLSRDFDRESLENPRHLLFESLVGGIVSMLYFLMGFVNEHESYVEFAPEYAVGIIALFNCIQKCKEKMNQEFPGYHPWHSRLYWVHHIHDMLGKQLKLLSSVLTAPFVTNVMVTFMTPFLRRTFLKNCNFARTFLFFVWSHFSWRLKKQIFIQECLFKHVCWMNDILPEKWWPFLAETKSPSVTLMNFLPAPSSRFPVLDSLV